ncbi:N-6 DNA methylase [Dehalobacter restrictus]|uniref:HsdM family class I SAM-dependent methyltransferase n=1 Tax=Dehalobacter restrictus TaxID=55583 RepID=UPI0033900F64
MVNKIEISQVLNFVHRELSKWEFRNAANDNPSAALVFFSFLKYVSDNRQSLQLDFDEKFSFDYLSILFGERLDKNELVNHIGNVERQLGHRNGILESYASSLNLNSFSRKNTQIMDALNSIDMTDAENEHLIYEALVSYFSVTVNKELRFSGEFITEQNLAKLMASIGSPKHGTVYDFASGYGILAVESAKGKDVHIYAQDINRTCAAVTIMMLTMAGCKSSTVLCGDTLTNSLYSVHRGLAAFDSVLSVPPFGMKLSNTDATFRSGDQANAFEYGLEFKLNSEMTFSRHLLASLKKDGTGVIQVPMGALFRSGTEEKIRANMIKDNYIDTIVELPTGVVSGTGVKTALIVFKKGRSHKDIYILDASRDAAKDFVEANGRAGTRITDYGVNEISRLIKERKVVEGLSAIITPKDIQANNFNLSVGAYLQKNIENIVVVDDIETLQKKNAVLVEKLNHIDKRLNEAIERTRCK